MVICRSSTDSCLSGLHLHVRCIYIYVTRSACSQPEGHGAFTSSTRQYCRGHNIHGWRPRCQHRQATRRHHRQL